MHSGFAASTLRAIMARAGLRDAAFYDQFAEKRQAFEVLHELAVQRAMGVGATAYFSARHWPERVWRCLLATSQFYAAHPAIAHVGYLEAHVLGPSAIQRVEDARQVFTTLLRAGTQHADLSQNVTAAEAIGAAVFEMAHDRVCHQRARDLPRYAYHATYLALAPFLGVQAADRFVQGKVRQISRDSASASDRSRT
jgi:AcrR family transcriptional regulator